MPRGGGPTQAELLAAATNKRDWLYATHDYAGSRFVDNAQINTSNAAKLKPLCIYRSDIPGPTQTNPLVYKGVMYVTVENYTAAIDAKTCRARWTYRWKSDGKAISLANRGVAIKDGVLVRGTPDGHLIALDMEKGTLLWSRKIAEFEAGQYLSMPPLMFEDLVIYGPAGADFGPKNWVGGFRIATGEQVWRFNLVPDANEPGADTWKDPKSLEHGGGSLWTPLALDAATGTLFLPVGNPAPDFYGDVRVGDNLYTNSVVALDVRTGKLRWYKQFGPNDVWDSDLTQVSPVFSAQVGGRHRDLLAVAGKDGLLRVLDRKTQEMLFEVPITTRTNVDTRPTVEGIHRCPGLLGGMEYNGPAYNPKTQTLFTGANDWCGTFKLSAEAPSFAPATHYYGGGVTPDPHDQARGWLMAFDAVTGKARWKKEWPETWSSALVATSGNVIFTGSADNDFLVIDQKNGDVLYRFNTGGSIGGGVVSYEIDGKQYVATTSGVISGFHGGSGTSAIVIFGL
jgi:alcohol dehydrogenase (cytochrome c)